MYKLLSILLFAYSLAITTEDIYDNSYAIIIGISEYQNMQHLNYGSSDAEAIHNLLISEFGFPVENTILLLNEQATALNIKKSLSKIIKKAKSNDRILVYFSGHGMTEDLPGGGEMGYLIPFEGEFDELYLTSIPMTELKAISNRTEANHLLYLVDACYGGTATIRSKGDNVSDYMHNIINDKAHQIITAGGRGEQVIEKSEWGHSAFTRNLLKGLQTGIADMNYDGYITARELASFLKERVTIESEGYQTPQFGQFSSDMGEFIFIQNNVLINAIGEIIQEKNKKDELEKVENQEKQKSYDFIVDNLDSIMQSSNYDLILSDMSKEQLITLLALPTEEKKNFPNDVKEKKLFNQKDNFYDNSFAVIIGINEYTNSKPLKYAVNDAKAIKELLINTFGFQDENIKLLLDKEATYSSIRHELYTISRLAEINDRILIYFSGHGQTIKAVGSDMQIGYLIPVNGDIKEPTLTGIPMDDIFRISQSNSKHMLFLMDACYSGLMAEDSKGLNILENNDIEYIPSVANISARQIITAGSAEQEVWEGDELQHGVFTSNILKALGNWEADNYYEDGYITATELGEYLKKAVFDESGGRQTPQVERIKRSKRGEFIFARNP